MATTRVLPTKLQLENLKRTASKRKRASGRKHSAELDQIANEHKFANWALLSKAASAAASAPMAGIVEVTTGSPMISNSELSCAVRAVFRSSLFCRMISDGLDSLCGNPNGTTYAQGGSEKPVCLDDTGKLLDDGANLIRAVLGACTLKESIREMDVEVNSVGFCLTMIGPPTTERVSWGVTRRDGVSSVSHRAIAISVEV